MHPPGRPNRESLRLIAKVWARRGTGALLSPAGRAILVQGEPKDDHSLSLAVAAMYEEAVTFSPRDLFAGGARLVGPELWLAASRRANLVGVRERMDHALVERPGAHGIGRLPLSDDTRAVLAQENSPRHTLADLVASAKADPIVVASDISVLVVLGLHKLRRAASGGGRPAARAIVQTPVRDASFDSRQGDRAVQRLNREWANIEHADDYTVVGVSQQMPEEVVQRACERMLGRYSRLAEDERLPTEARELAGAIHQRVSDAVVRLRQGRGTRHNRLTSSEPLAAGLSFVNQGDWTRAVKCFNMARHKNPNNADAVAWLAWSVFNDPTLPQVKRRKKARDLLALSETLDFGSSVVTFLAARLDYAEGDLVRAWNRLDGLVTRDADNREAREWLVRVQKEIKHRK